MCLPNNGINDFYDPTKCEHDPSGHDEFGIGIPAVCVRMMAFSITHISHLHKHLQITHTHHTPVHQPKDKRTYFG